jgi:small conductance mechanosensitive channel
MEPEADSASSRLTQAVAQLDDDLARLQRLNASIAGTAMDKEALIFRSDNRGLRLLKKVDEISAAVLKLPEDSPLKEELKSRLVEDFEPLGRGVLGRLDELDKVINEETGKAKELRGLERELADTRIASLEDVRDSYFEAMARHLETRSQFGLSNDATLLPMQERLALQAEDLSGRIGLSSLAARDIGRKLYADKTDTDLQDIYNWVTQSREHDLERLRRLTAIMQDLGVDTSEYSSMLVKEGTGISLDMIKPGVLNVLMEEWTDSALGFLQSKGPDLAIDILVFIGIIVLFQALAKLARKTVQTAMARSSLDLSQLLKDTVVSITGGAVMLLGVLMALSQVGISLGPMLAGLGIAGFIVGFALQDTLANFAAGAMILIYRPYDVDDYIQVAGASGSVKKMNLVSTTINTFDNQTLVVPNGKIWGDVINNVTGQKVRRVDLEFGISYSDDIGKAENILAQLAAEHELVLPSPETMVKVNSLGDSSVNLILRPWVKTSDYWSVYWDLTRAVKLRFDSEGISIPFPQRDMHLYPRQADTT